MSCCASALIQINQQLTRLTGGVLYFDTELKFSIDRLVEIISTMMPSVYHSEWAFDAPHRLQSLLTSLHLRRPTSCAELLQQIENIEEYILQNQINLVLNPFFFKFNTHCLRLLLTQLRVLQRKKD